MTLEEFASLSSGDRIISKGMVCIVIESEKYYENYYIQLEHCNERIKVDEFTYIWDDIHFELIEDMTKI